MRVPNDQRGFTLIEIVVTIVIAAILGTLMVQFVGTALTQSSRPVDQVRDDVDNEKILETIISYYVAAINADPPTGALASVVTFAGTNYASKVTTTYITFGSTGEELTSGTPTDNLKVSIQGTGRWQSIILTNSRVKSDDPISKY